MRDAKKPCSKSDDVTQRSCGGFRKGGSATGVRSASENFGLSRPLPIMFKQLGVRTYQA